MYKVKVLLVLTLGLAISIASMSGCSKKKKIVEPVKKEEVRAPQTKPAPPAVVPRAPRKVEETVPRDLSFTTIYFDFDKSAIRSDQRTSLERNASLMNRYKTVRIRLEGHCDERGTEEYNIALGQRRADAVMQYLSDYGISRSRVQTISYGEMRPVDSGHSESAWSKNRRCEIAITGK